VTRLAELAEAFGGIDPVLIGAQAANRYMPSRATLDIDFAVGAEDAGLVEVALRDHGWTLSGRLAMTGMTGTGWVTGAREQVDVAYLPPPWGHEAMTTAREDPMLGVRVVSLPFLVLMKLLAARSKDTGDVEELLINKGRRQLEAVRLAVRRYGRPDDLEDLDQIIQLAGWRAGPQR